VACATVKLSSRSN